jgi:sugar phosphate isomerase/epimerase
VGHAHLDQDVLSAIGTMGDRIRSVHVHDNMKDKDSHLWPGDGTIPWPETMQALAALREPPALVLEIQRTPDSPGNEVKDRLRRSFEFLDSPATVSQPRL